MSKVIDAVYENGVFRPLEPVLLPEGEHVQVHMPEQPPTLHTRLAALDAFEAVDEELTEEQWRVLGIVMIDHPVLDKAAELYARLRASGQLIEDADLLIAAIALVHDMTLVTNNTAHFSRISGLQVEDWLLS